MEIEDSEDNKSLYINLKKAMENKNPNDHTRLLENRIVIEMPSMNKMPKSEEDNELNVNFLLNFL